MKLFNSSFILIWTCLIHQINAVNKSIGATRGFLFYRTVFAIQRSCNCSMSFSCSCCQSVTILYTRKEKDLCVNFTYQRNGLNMDIALSSDTISTRTVLNYKAFQFCVHVPGCFFSTACVNILELNRFSKSITTCLRLDIYAKKQLWQINYDCMSISTELPSLSMNGVTRMMDLTSEGMFTAGTEQMRQSLMTESMMDTTSMMDSTETSQMNSVLMTGMMEQANRTNGTIVE